MVTTNELAELLGVTRQTVESLRKSGRIPAIQITKGKRRSVYRYEYDEVLRALKENTDRYGEEA
jgi:excisionase family DNA binding protein